MNTNDFASGTLTDFGKNVKAAISYEIWRFDIEGDDVFEIIIDAEDFMHYGQELMNHGYGYDNLIDMVCALHREMIS